MSNIKCGLISFRKIYIHVYKKACCAQSRWAINFRFVTRFSMFCAYTCTSHRYQVSVYRTDGPLVVFMREYIYIGLIELNSRLKGS